MARTKPRTDLTSSSPKPLDPLPENTQLIERTGDSAVLYHIPTSATSPGSSSHAPSSPNLKTTILLPRHSKWTSGLHWHNTHTEYLHLIKGCIFVRLGSDTHIISAAAGGNHNWGGGAATGGLVVKVDKGVRHNWGRAQHYLHRRYIGVPYKRFPKDLDDEVVVEEWTDPLDVGKPLFFWNLNGILLAPENSNQNREQGILRRAIEAVLGRYWIPVQLFLVFWELDNFPVFFEFFAVYERQNNSWVAVTLEYPLEAIVTYSMLFLASFIGRLAGVEAVSEERTPKNLWEVWRLEKGLVKKSQ